MNPAAIALTVGVVHLVMALMLATLLIRRHEPLRVSLWSLGALTSGIWLALVGLRGEVPDWASYGVANSLSFASLLLRLSCLRLECGEDTDWRRHGLVWIACSIAYEVTVLAQSVAGRVAISVVAHVALTVRLWWYARRAAEVMESPAGRLLARVEALWVVTLTLRVLAIAAGWQDLDITAVNLGNWWLAFAALLVACFGNLAYMGMVLDHAQAKAHRALAIQAEQAAGRRVAEQQSQTLIETLAQRDTLIQQRERLVSVLAHEIRQPLHSAAGALLSATAALQALPAKAGTDPVVERMNEAQNVLVDLRTVLDNTLAAAEILVRDTPPARQEIDIDWVVAMAIGDLPLAQRQQIQVERLTRLRSLEAEPGLIRLAVRNLLRNAFEHGLGIQGRVTILIEESEAPDALCIRVRDHGPGLAESKRTSLLDDTQPLSSSWLEQTSGLGLVIVRRIMTLHGGWLQLDAVQPRGLMASLVFPWLEAPGELRPGSANP